MAGFPCRKLCSAARGTLEPVVRGSCREGGWHHLAVMRLAPGEARLSCAILIACRPSGGVGGVGSVSSALRG